MLYIYTAWLISNYYKIFLLKNIITILLIAQYNFHILYDKYLSLNIFVQCTK